MQDAWKAYVELALGLTEASRKKAMKTAKRVLGKGGATVEQLQGLADDLVRTSLANREAIAKLIRYELDRALGVVGLATAEEVTRLADRIRDLEQQLRDLAKQRGESAGEPQPQPQPTAEAKPQPEPPTGASEETRQAAEEAAARVTATKTAATQTARKVAAKKAVSAKQAPAATGEPEPPAGGTAVAKKATKKAAKKAATAKTEGRQAAHEEMP